MSILCRYPDPLARCVAGPRCCGIRRSPVRALLQTIKNRRDATMLAGLDDHMLADIGLTRGDLRDAYSEPVWRDPTAILVSRSHERRINRRRVRIGLAEKTFEAPSIVPAPGVTSRAKVGARDHERVIPKKPVPHAIRDGHRFSDKITRRKPLGKADLPRRPPAPGLLVPSEAWTRARRPLRRALFRLRSRKRSHPGARSPVRARSAHEGDLAHDLPRQRQGAEQSCARTSRRGDLARPPQSDRGGEDLRREPHQSARSFA